MKYSHFALGLICVSSLAFATQDTKQSKLGAGFVQYPEAGAKPLAMENIPAVIRHAAEVTLSGYGTGTTITGASMDFDDIGVVYEIQATSADGRHMEVDVDANGKVEEFELEVPRQEIPAVVLEALSKHAPDYQPSQEVPLFEKSIRPSKNGLLEIWYEFSGTNFDVEIRNDGKAVLIEPA